MLKEVVSSVWTPHACHQTGKGARVAATFPSPIEPHRWVVTEPACYRSASSSRTLACTGVLDLELDIDAPTPLGERSEDVGDR